MGRKFRIVTSGAGHPWVRALLVAVVVVLVGVGAWWLYGYAQHLALAGVHSAGRRSQQVESNNRKLARQLRSTRNQNAKLAGDLAYMKRSQQIDGGACTLVKKSLANLQQENSNLREQLAFYRGIVSPKQSAAGLRIYDFKVSQHGHAAREYDFELLLVQSLHHNRVVRGQAVVQIEGLQGTKPKTYQLTDLMVGKPDVFSFSFKYFQELDGHVRLPAGFRPVRVTVMLNPRGKDPSVTHTYDWSKVQQGTSEE